MIIGQTPFTNMFFDDGIPFNQINRLELQDCKVNEIKIDEQLLEYITTKEDWGYNTILLGKFQGDNTVEGKLKGLEAGNLNNNGMKIDKIVIKKRKDDDLQWQQVKIFDFDVDKKSYDYIDRLVESLETYEYAVQPMSGNVLGSESTSQVDCDFENVWLVGKDEQYALRYNLEEGDTEIVQKSKLYETIGGQYPVIRFNGNLNYKKKNNIKALLISNSTINYTGNSQIDRRAEKKLRKDINSFLCDKRIKVYKNGHNGDYMAIMIVGTPKLTPKNEVSQMLFEVSFDIVEIGNVYDEKLLKQNGFLE